MAMKQNREHHNFSFSDYATRWRELRRQTLAGSLAGGDLELHFQLLAQALFELQYAHNLVFRQLCQHRQITPSSRPPWASIPAIPTRAFKELDVTCLPVDQRPFVFYTSGTTQSQPGRHFHHAESLALYEASLLPWFRRHLLADSIPLAIVSLTPPKVLAPNSSLVHMLDTVARNEGGHPAEFVGCLGEDGGWRIDYGKLCGVIELLMARKQPVVLLGTAFNFVQVLDYCEANRIRFNLPPGSSAMETGGYKGRSRTLSKSELHSLISSTFGVPGSHLVCEYGMCELSSQAYDATVPMVPGPIGTQTAGANATAPNRVFHFPPWARVLVVSPETGREVAEGDTGLIQVIDLANAWSVMAVQTEDLGVRRGSGFELIGRLTQTAPRGCSLNS